MSITEDDIKFAAVWTADKTGRKVHQITVAYRRDQEDDGIDWTVSIRYPQARGRGSWTSLDGYGETPADAAKMAVETYRRAEADGLVKVEG